MKSYTINNVSPVGETCPSRGASTSGVAAPGMPAPDDRSRSTVHYKLHSRGVPQRTLSPAHPHAAIRRKQKLELEDSFVREIHLLSTSEVFCAKYHAKTVFKSNALNRG
ncbi:hypothetical protein NECAME_02961 [Necator americanus]|uniref:Uncharacterized protein n=1 Tax=Necator americanus TaxID=51031 RepID=W2T8E2_NECAM|nr:hypothetical protein NECAME_02961 [Necator americanus]ETN78255.1 hypothetical protein NECAME_02961 [Necator americanus]